ncbi:beta-ketoacyl synthase [Moorena producens PAL-8-15-08-1]|uniref:Beta-ketoacyl synthase n=1 Tax=Moorena producens PAL-8-15-08-1 TaxID=1458985 RepID=A0A1D8TW20_9CYAN|nr:type I polyketide synthase [Moorena producens]AOX01784.1 beta-ketoacyl synthase [Moorena producens PAL-8-15-08-1]
MNEIEPIAIIGIGCRLPGAKTPEAFWQLLRNGVDAITEVPPERWDIDTFYDPSPATSGKMYTRWGGFVEQVDRFEPSFFGISPREAQRLDPQQRLLLEVVWEALENAAIVPESLARSQTGVFIGISNADYHRLIYKDCSGINAYSGTGTASSVAANRLSYVLNLFGPSVAIDTACSSSLVALHYACGSLLSLESNLCLVGGVNLMLSPEQTITFSQAQMMAADGRCKTFDASADGYVRGEGCGVVVLKRLSDALRDGDNIQAIVRGSAVNQDGLTNGLTAPNGPSQQAVIRQALEKAGVKPAQISYIEAHGTGTSLGDPIEVKSLKAVLMEDREPDQPCWIGSVKTNIGHLEPAAGIAGLIKVVLSLQHGEIPPHLHFNQLNPYIKIKNTPIKIPTSLQKWSAGEKPKMAGVSSFGFGGTNAHVILEEAPSQFKIQNSKFKSEEFIERPSHILTLSAKCEKALQELAQRYQEFLANNSTAAIADICFTANTGRSHFKHRLAVVAESTEKLSQQLKGFETGVDTPGVVRGPVPSKKPPKIVFLFTGQGSQYVDMGRELYKTQPTFRKTLEQCDAILGAYQQKSLLSILYPEPGETSPIDQTAYTQPALFAIEYALFQLWKSWGIEPDVVMGHSVGEYVAACVAGVFSLEDGLKLIAHRGRLMQQLPSGGEMVAVMASYEKVNQLIAPYTEQVAIAAINGPVSTVISGAAEAIGTLLDSLEAEGIKTKQLQVSHAFHSPLMEPMLADFEAVASQMSYNQPRIPLISNVTGAIADESIATASYWVNHVRQPVKFAHSMETLQQLGYDVFLEIGPLPILLGMGKQCLPEELGVWLPSLRPAQEDWQQMLHSLAQLYVQGVKVDWLGFERDYSRSKVVLPTYPWQRQRYWIETDNTLIHKKQFLSNYETLHPLLGQRLRLAGFDQQIRFECLLSSSQPSYLKHHCVFSVPVLPAAAYLEIALAAGNTLFKSENLILEDVVIQQALILPEDELQTIQIVLTPQETLCYNFQIFSLDVGSQQSEVKWTLHVQGKLLAGDKDTQPKTTDLKTLIGEYNQQISPKDFYLEYKDRGIDYGDCFQAVRQLWCSEEKALGQIQLPETLVNQATFYQLHPVLLDASFQVLAAALDGTENQDTYLPVKIKRLQLHRRTSNTLWTEVEINATTASPQTLTGEVCLWDKQGVVVAVVEGLTVLRTSRQALLRTQEQDLKNWLYQIHWQAQSTSSQPESLDLKQSGSWLLFASPTGIGKDLAEFLQTQGQHCILVTPGTEYQQLNPQHYQLNPTESEDFARLLNESLVAQPSLTGIVHLWSLPSTTAVPSSLQELQNAQELGCGSVLHLVQAIVQSQNTALPRLWLVTQGSQSVGNSSPPVQFQQAPLWGLGRVIALEHPQLPCRLLDLDPTLEVSQAAQGLFKELLSKDVEDQIAYRQGVRYVPRLVQQQGISTKEEELQIPAEHPFQLKLSDYGLLDNLTLKPITRRAPEPEEVEIQVTAVGLNFRDVLNALGLLKEYYAEYLGITSAKELTFGFECAGTIVAVGEKVSHLNVGDDAIATIVPDALSSFVTTRAEFVVCKPSQISPTEAATIPLAFLTAYYGLEHLAQIQPGDRVLIHSAAGGVGQAAVQLAQMAGAEVIATASPPKWEFLKSQGVQHIMNSRTLDFAEEVDTLTQSEGVDIVLNSLNGEFIDKSFEVLATGGRFIEIGKIGIWDHKQVKEKRPDARYYPFDLGEVAQGNPNLIQTLLSSLVEKFDHGELNPLPHKVFPIQKAIEAFRHMQQTKHMGKVVISMAETSTAEMAKPVSVEREGSYLITGGNGALGLRVAQWMVSIGARHMVLMGRRAPSVAAQEVINQLEQSGAEVLVVSGDVSKEQDVARILAKIDSSYPPLRGVIHGAGVLDDGVLQQMSWERFTRVMAPKVEGAWHLHTLTEHLQLDFFVCFSSMASLLGSPGQGNYAAANGFMDALAHHRRAKGLPGLSINWGPWAEVGMAGRLDHQNQKRMTAQGISPIPPDQGLQVLEGLLTQPATQVSVFPVNWFQFLQQFPGNKIPTFLSEIAIQMELSEKIAPKQSELLDKLKQVNQQERINLLIAYLTDVVAKVLHLNNTNLPDINQGFFDMGMDSLMAVEFGNRLQSDLGVFLSSTTVFEYSNIKELAVYLDEVIPGDIEEEQSECTSTKQEDNPEKIAWEQVIQLSANELTTSIEEQLAQLETSLKENW